MKKPTLKTYQPSYRHCTSKSPFTRLHKNVISIKMSLKNISIIFHMILQKAQAHYYDEVTLALRHNWIFDLSPLAFVSCYYIRAPLHTYDTSDVAQWSRMFIKDWPIKFRSKHSTVLLMCLLRNLMEQTLCLQNEFFVVILFCLRLLKVRYAPP